MEEAFTLAAGGVALILDTMAVLVIGIGGLEATVGSAKAWFRNRATQGARRTAWLSFARWLLLGLEFTLASDIIDTVVAPDWESIGQLAAIAVIRTFLSYFLERDLEKFERTAGKKPTRKEAV